jgi:hypothetical protein
MLGRALARLRARALVLFASIGACGSTPASGPAPSIGGHPELSRADWLSYSRRSLRRETCTKDSRFRRCSDVDRDRCEREMTHALAKCDEAYRTRLPEHITAGDADTHARDQLTGCMWHHAVMSIGPADVDIACLLTSK